MIHPTFDQNQIEQNIENLIDGDLPLSQLAVGSRFSVRCCDLGGFVNVQVASLTPIITSSYSGAGAPGTFRVAFGITVVFVGDASDSRATCGRSLSLGLNICPPHNKVIYEGIVRVDVDFNQLTFIPDPNNPSILNAVTVTENGFDLREFDQFAVMRQAFARATRQ